MTTCPECGEPGGAHAASCSLARFDGPVPPPGNAAIPAADPYRDLLTEIRDDVRMLRRAAVFGLVLLVLWMLAWIVSR